MPSSRPKIIVNKNTPQAIEVFSMLGDVVGLSSPEFTPDVVRDADILIVRSETRVDTRLLEGSSVRFVGTVTIGTDHIDTEYLRSRGIQFASAPGSNARSVAEYVCAALFEAWEGRVGGKTLGVVGVGHVGDHVTRMAKVLGMQVLMNDPPLERSGKKGFCSLDDLMKADAISIHVPLTKTGPDPTHHLFDKSRIARMKSGSILINTSRGPVVESNALKNALSSHHLSAAILDVWEHEPEIDVDLLKLVLFGTPHIAGYSLNGRLNAVQMVYEETCGFLGVPAAISPTRDFYHRENITIPSHLTRAGDIIRFAIKSAYNIRQDNALLRHIHDSPPDKRGKYFSGLRSEYRTRLEFRHWNVQVPTAQQHAAEVLRQLGFTVVIS